MPDRCAWADAGPPWVVFVYEDPALVGFLDFTLGGVRSGNDPGRHGAACPAQWFRFGLRNANPGKSLLPGSCRTSLWKTGRRRGIVPRMEAISKDGCIARNQLHVIYVGGQVPHMAEK